MNVMDRFDISGKVAVVTGASRGLGKGYALGLAAAGAHVVCCSRNRDALESTVSEIRASGGSGEARVLDVSRPDEPEKVFRAVFAERERLDILINNAGFEDVSDFTDVTEAQYDAIMGVNLKGSFFAAQAAARIMKLQKRGKILNVGSLGSAIGLAGSSVYCASKGGIVQMTRALAIELAKDNVQVNAIGPGYFRTPMTEPFFRDPEHRKWIEERIPVGRVGTDDDLIGPVIFLCSAASDYLTGQIIYVDGGWLAS
jgi:NAD(P)-dependent dehydrogenase (short-subunit alcohol dehydrogenase family)